MKILFFGSDGFIGENLKNYFRENGYEVCGTTFLRNPCENETKIDIRNPQEFEKLSDINFDIVINATGVVDQNSPRKIIFDVNTQGTKNILDWAQKRRCRHFIQISSIAVYGFRVLGVNRRENNTKRYDGKLFLPYGRSKALAENYVEKSSLDYTILRLPAVLC